MFGLLVHVIQCVAQFTQPLSIYFLLLAPSGTRKSQVCSIVENALFYVEQRELGHTGFYIIPSKDEEEKENGRNKKKEKKEPRKCTVAKKKNR
jgi:hypothetical protein